MVNLEHLDYEEEKNYSYKVEACFGGFLEDGFVVKCFIDVETETESIDQSFAEEEMGVDPGTRTIVEGFYFHLIEVYNAGGELITLSSTLNKEIKQEIEDYITNEIQD